MCQPGLCTGTLKKGKTMESINEIILNCVMAEVEQSERQPVNQLHVESHISARPTLPAPPLYPQDVDFWMEV